ncbi:MAG TPA: NFACT family protein [Bacteroidota bacterium]|jgi:predicted ribosome quality control (RQC) complex YloA/Tae2 family protein|nr:NFACT family protein [Bacteroidota bacterium]
MITNFYTLLALADELRSALRGCPVSEIYTQQKNELCIVFDDHLMTPHGSAAPSLSISVDPQFNYCFLRDGASRARKNSVDLFPDVTGKVLEDVTALSFDRIIHLRFAGGLTLRILLYNTAESNVLLTGDRDVVCEAFKNNKNLRGTQHTDTIGRFSPRYLEDVEVFRGSLTVDPSLGVFAALKYSIPILGSTLARETLHRSAIDEKQPVGQLRSSDVGSIHRHLRAIIEEASTPSPRIYVRGNESRIFSLIQLAHLSGSTIESHPTVNDAIRSFVLKTFSTKGFEAAKNGILGPLKNERDRAQRSVDRMSAELEDTRRAASYDRLGRILMANIHEVHKGLSKINLPDVFADNAVIPISLDPKLTPHQNAERYFEKSRKSRTSRSDLERRRTAAQQKAALLETMLLHLDNCHTAEQVKEFKTTHGKELKAMKLVPHESPKDQPPFRMFTVAGGFEVWVGKSSANNDLLTMKYAKPNDLWFHARGASGSHVVLKLSGGEPPPKEAIRQAAGIAAYYSKMRKARDVPVAYCERKYVRKPKGVPPGTVTLEREKVVFVQPRLPATPAPKESS